MTSLSWRSIKGWLRLILQIGLARRVRGLVADANRHRDAGEFAQALPLYEDAVRLASWRSDLGIQAGHMAKETRRFDIAEAHYRRAEAERPTDADLQLQMGHFYKRVDRLEQASDHYRAAARLSPGFEAALRETAALDRRRGRAGPVAIMDEVIAPAPELVPGAPYHAPPLKLDEIVFRKLGNGWAGSSIGNLPVLAGIEALRGLCLVEREIVAATVSIDDVVVHRGSVRNVPCPDTGFTKAVFNLWFDCSAFASSPRRLELVLVDCDGRSRSRFEIVYVEVAPQESEHPQSDGVLTLLIDEAEDLETAIRSRPSMIRFAGQTALAIPRSILVLRTDQLGDMVVSLPAMTRLRSLFPDARIVGLVTEANADFARTLGVFDEIIAVAFPDDFQQRKRIMTASAQRALQARLAAYRFDLAIDLATSDVSRPLLQLSGARFTFGFGDAAFPWLGGSVSGDVHALREGSEASPHAGRVLAMVERIATLVDAAPPIVRRSDLMRDGLSALGIHPEAPYVVMHIGARIRFSRWPHYRELAQVLHERTGMAVVIVGDESTRDGWGLLPPGIQLIEARLPFDELDRLLSHARLFIGNDSGPKHLAALRGVPVLSIHSARIHWLEWGQQQTGLIMSRRVPCAGCAIFHDEDECGIDHACINDIRVDEVALAAMSLLADTQQPD